MTLPIALVSGRIPLALVLGTILQDLLVLLNSLHSVVLVDWISEVPELPLDLLHSLIVVVTLTIGVALESVHARHGLCLESVPLLHTTTGEDSTEESLDLYYRLSVCA